MADVSAHEDEGVGCCPSETGDVADGVTGHVEDVEATVAEEIEGRILSDFVFLVEADFSNVAAPP
ncbi:MAG: hypothetical protein Q9168_007507 [Polycauliona sp. 1 TL-2023]